MGLITHGASALNYVKAWPPLVRIGSGFDLVTNAHWFRDVGTPTTKATAVPASGEAGLTANFLEVIKCVTDAADEGWAQRYTFADEGMRVGGFYSAAVWVGSTAGGVDCAVKLVNSDASETVGVLVETDGDFDLYVVEAHQTAGTFMDLQVTKDTAGTFYAGGRITVMRGENVVELPPRPMVFRHTDDTPVLKTLTGLGDEDTWTDVDCTSSASALATIAVCLSSLFDSTAGDDFRLRIRRNGDDEAKITGNLVSIVAGSGFQIPQYMFEIILDENGIFEYNFDRNGGSGTLASGVICLRGFWEWAA